MKRDNFTFTATLVVTLTLSLNCFAKTVALSDDNRAELLKSMQVWREVDTASLNLFKGPRDDYKFTESVYCKFKELEEGDYGSGKTPKFKCIKRSDGTSVKVKYGIRNPEVYAEVASSRLFSALGFYHDNYFPVRILCDDCPKDPWFYIKNRDKTPRRIRGVPYEPFDFRIGVHTFSPAIIEVKTSGARVENYKDQGVSWKEFNDFSGLSLKDKTIRDAYILLMGFIHHADSKPEQQRLTCMSENLEIVESGHKCSQAKFLVQDGGWSFGAGIELSSNTLNAKMNLEFWKYYPVFKKKKRCKLGVRVLPGYGFINKEISENGRAFLANLLNKLSRKQIKDIFRASRVDFREYVLRGTPTEDTLNAWTDAFVEKRAEINSAKCPKKLVE